MILTCSFIVLNDEPCGEMCEGRTTMCASHNRQVRREETEAKKQAEKRQITIQKAKAKSMEPRKSPNKISEKRKELNKEYFKLVEQFKKDNPHCKANVNEYCTKTTDDPHHRKGRGEFLLSVDFWLPVCRSCHDYIEAHPLEAKEKGWSESRLTKHEPHKI